MDTLLLSLDLLLVLFLAAILSLSTDSNSSTFIRRVLSIRDEKTRNSAHLHDHGIFFHRLLLLLLMLILQGLYSTGGFLACYTVPYVSDRWGRKWAVVYVDVSPPYVQCRSTDKSVLNIHPHLGSFSCRLHQHRRIHPLPLYFWCWVCPQRTFHSYVQLSDLV